MTGSTPRAAERMGTRRTLLLVVVATLAASIFNLDKALHIDDPLVVDALQAILVDPLRPYSGITHHLTLPLPLWSVETNPPFLGYYVVPFSWLPVPLGLALHVAMVPFVALLAGTLAALAIRFGAGPGLALILGIGNVGVLATTNVMRDVPAAALAACAILLWIRGVDERRRSQLLLGAAFAGLAIVTKYSSIVLLPVLGLYSLLHRSPATMPWLAVFLVPFGAWCAQNLHVHGILHVVDVSRRPLGTLSAVFDNLATLPVAYGALLYLGPVLLLAAILGRRWTLLIPIGLGSLAAPLAIRWLLGGGRDLHAEAFALLGATLLGAVLAASACGAWRLLHAEDDDRARDDVFLGLWIAAFAVFSVVFAPFQAIRHALPAVPAVVILALRMLGEVGRGRRAVRGALGFATAAQVLVAALVAVTDARLAETYRDATRSLSTGPDAQDRTTWFVGGWSFSLYANAAGFTPLGPGARQPVRGDRIVWPREVNQDVAFRNHYRPMQRWRRIDERTYSSVLPVRTLGAGEANLYALQSGAAGTTTLSVPYRFGLDAPLEVVYVFEVP